MRKDSLLPIVTTDRANNIGQRHLETKPGKSKKPTELHWAVINADHDRLKNLLGQAPSPPRQLSILKKSGNYRSLDVNDQDELGWTALHWAMRKKDQQSAETLLGDVRTDHSLRDRDGRIPLHQAAIYDWAKGIKILLQKEKADDTIPKSAGVTVKDNGGRTALHWAAEYGHTTVTKALAEQANCEEIDNGGNTAMHRAAQRGHEDVVEILATNHAYLKPKNSEGKTPFQIAAENGQEKMALLFFSKFELEDQSHSMALILTEKLPLRQDINRLMIWAAEAGFTDVMQGLLDKEAAHINGRLIKDSHTWLIYAAANGHEAIVELLLQKGAVQTSDRLNRTPLSYAAENGHEAIVELLLRKGAVQISDHLDGVRKARRPIIVNGGAGCRTVHTLERTPLSYAAGNGHQAIVQLLIDNDADYDFKDRLRRTPFSYAAANGHEAIVELLLQKGAVQTSDRLNRTPLSYAAENGHEAIVQFLINKDVDYKTGDHNQRTPLSYAAGNGHEAIIQLLIDKGAEYKASDSIKRTPLLYAAKNGHEAIVQLLINKDADYQAGDDGKRTPLSYAAENGHDATVELLLQKGAVQTSDRLNRMPLWYAAENGHEAIVSLLKKATAIEASDARPRTRTLTDTSHDWQKKRAKDPRSTIDTWDSHSNITKVSYKSRKH